MEHPDTFGKSGFAGKSRRTLAFKVLDLEIFNYFVVGIRF
jgi:hypothetical protein